MVATRRLTAMTAELSARSDFPQGPLMVALSGGGDSAALAYLAQIVSPGPVRAIHVHHGLADSDRLEAAATAIADALGLEMEAVRVHYEGRSEDAGRRARYRVLLERIGRGDWLLTGHTSDDQAETVLANLLRGAGLEGLAGIPARRPPIARPLLGVSRGQTRELASLAGLAWFDDPANSEPGPLRNRIRHHLIPLLEGSFNPELRRRLATTAVTVAGMETGPVAPSEVTDGGLRFSIGALWALGKPGTARSLREGARLFRGGYGLDSGEIDRVWSVITGQAVATELTGGARVERSGPWLMVGDGPALSGELPAVWRVPGSLRWGSFWFSSWVDDIRPRALPLTGWRAVLDFDRVGELLTITHGEDGPLVLGSNGPVWAPGRGALPAGWIETTTRRYLSTHCCVEASWHRSEP